MKPRDSVCLAAVTLLLAVATIARADESVTVKGPVAVSGHPDASKAGLDILKSGGNAIDALVAVSTSLGVVEPGNSGLGAKLIVVYYDAKSRKASSLIALCAAPQSRSLEDAKEGSSGRGWKGACVPGLVSGLGAVHEKWGTKPWKDVVAPSIKLAREGFVIDQRASEMWADLGKPEGETQRIYAPGGNLPKPGDRLTNPDLGHTLELIANGGAKAFYEGEIPDKIIAAAAKSGVKFTREDFAAYKPRFLEPLTYTYKGNTVIAAPPPVSGGVTIMGALKVMEQEGTAGAKTSRDPQYIDLLGRALIASSTAVSRNVGDVPDSAARVREAFTPGEIREMVAKAKAEKLGNPTTRPADEKGPDALRDGLTFPPGLLASGRELTADDAEEGCTTPMIIQDAEGNICVATQSLGLHFGSKVTAEGTGILMNSDMSNFAFTTKTSVNLYAPGKWARSTIGPTLFMKDGKPVLATSAAGSARIPTSMLQIMTDVLEFGRDPLEAVRQPRFHIASKTAELEAGTPMTTVTALEALGWSTSLRKPGGFYFANCQLFVWHPNGTVTAVADKRRTSDAQGANVPD